MSQAAEKTPIPAVGQWSTRRALAILSAAWLVLSQVNVLVVFGAYFALEPLFRNAMASDQSIYLPTATFVIVGAVWLVADWALRRYRPRIGDPMDQSIVGTPIWMLFAAMMLQFWVLLSILVRIDAPAFLAVNAVTTAGLIGAMINRWVFPHVMHRVLPTYPTRRWDSPTDGRK